MRWYHYVAWFFGGVFFANAIPHLVHGISGMPFHSPFATPPGEGISTPMVNVLWAFFNLAVGYLLVCRVGDFNLRNSKHAIALGAGFLLMSMMCAHIFGRMRGLM
jgi:hypothetical protein